MFGTLLKAEKCQTPQVGDIIAHRPSPPLYKCQVLLSLWRLNQAF